MTSEQLKEEAYHWQEQALLERLTNGLPPLIRFPGYIVRDNIPKQELADRVDIYNLPLFEGFGNGKMPAALCILQDIKKQTKDNFPKVLVVPSSGNTVANIAHMAPWFGVEQVYAFVDGAVSAGKRGQILKANPNVQIVSVEDGQSTIDCARRFAEQQGYYFVDQYSLVGSMNGHVQWTWPHVTKQLLALNVEPSLVCLALGTTAAFVSAHCLREKWPHIQIVGTACHPDETIPGARTVKKLEATNFNYKKYIGEGEESRLILCSAWRAEEMGDALYRYASYPGGLSSAMAIAAGLQFVNKRGMSLVNSKDRIPLLTVGMDAAAVYYADRRA